MPIEKLNYVWTQLMKSLRDKFLLLRYLFTQGNDQWDITHYFGPGVPGHYLASLSSYKQKHQHDRNTTTWKPKIPKTQHRTKYSFLLLDLQPWIAMKINNNYWGEEEDKLVQKLEKGDEMVVGMGFKHRENSRTINTITRKSLKHTIIKVDKSIAWWSPAHKTFQKIKKFWNKNCLHNGLNGVTPNFKQKFNHLLDKWNIFKQLASFYTLIAPSRSSTRGVK